MLSMAVPARLRWAALAVATACAAVLVLAGPFGGGRGDGVTAWPRVGQANLAGWAVYEGDLVAGADLADAVIAADLDVVGVVEACEQQFAEAERLLADRGPVQAVFHRTVRADHTLPWGAQSDDECVYGIGLLARGPVTLAEVAASELPSLDGDPGGFDREEDRWALCARTVSEDPLIDGVHACTTHFTRWEVADGRRRSQAEHLAGLLSPVVASRSPVLVLADLNARRGDRDLDPVYALGLVDAGGGGDSRDHVLVGGVRAGRLRTATVGRADHELIWAPVAVSGTASR